MVQKMEEVSILAKVSMVLLVNQSAWVIVEACMQVVLFLAAE
jgi:hypothetical protein